MEQPEGGVDMMKNLYAQLAINAVTKDEQFLNRLKTQGWYWRGIIQQIEEALPEVMDDQNKNSIANSLVPLVLNALPVNNSSVGSASVSTSEGDK